MKKKEESFSKDTKNVLQFFWDKRKFIIVFTFSASLISGIVVFLMTPLFLSTAIIFPAATSSVSFSEQRNAKAASMDFGEEEQAEQLIQILQSARIRDKIMDKFNLMSHYRIASDGKNKNFKLNEAYNSHITFSRTKFGSIKIDVLDEDPAFAAKIANKIVDLIDTVKNEMITERTLPAFKVNQRKLSQLKHDRDSILNKLDSLSNLGVIALDVRSNLFQAYVDSKNEDDRAELKKKIEVNLKYGALYDGLEYMRNAKIINLEDFMASYEQAESDANIKFNHKFIVERAVPADKKDQPKRLVIILVTAFLAFIFAIFLLLFWEKYKELKN
jgi:uncharacterized protein involved in exopolysaccharide biosynthesis